VTITSDGGTHAVALDGTGTTYGISVSPASVSFGAVSVGSASANQTITVTNTGTAPLPMSSAYLGGPNSGDFEKTQDTCQLTTLSPGASCTYQVRFAPTTTGWRSSDLTILSHAQPQSVPLSGTGIDTTAPVSEFTTQNGAILLSAAHVISGRTTDDVTGATSLVVTITPVLGALSPWTVTPYLSCNYGGKDCTWSVAAPTLTGSYVVNARATDAAGNAESPGPTISVTVIA
jgi:hypothetical protein